MFLERTLFSLEDDSITGTKIFLKYIDSLKASGKLMAPPLGVSCYYDGDVVQMFLVTSKDYKEYVEPKGFQGSTKKVFLIPGDVRQPAVSVNSEGVTEALQPLVQRKDFQEASKYSKWVNVVGSPVFHSFDNLIQ